MDELRRDADEVVDPLQVSLCLSPESLGVKKVTRLIEVPTSLPRSVLPLVDKAALRRSVYLNSLSVPV